MAFVGGLNGRYGACSRDSERSINWRAQLTRAAGDVQVIADEVEEGFVSINSRPQRMA